MASYGMVTVYRDRKTGDYLIQPMCRHPTGAAAEWGEAVRITGDELDPRVAETVLELIGRFDQHQYNRESAPKISKEDYRRFVREHDGLTVTRTESGRVEVNPWRHERGGFLGNNRQMLILEMGEVATRLAWAIGEAFERTE